MQEWILKFALNYKRGSIAFLSVIGIVVVVLSLTAVTTLTKTVSQLELARDSLNKKHAAVTVLIILSVQLATMLIIYGIEIYFIIVMTTFEACDIEGKGLYVYVNLYEGQYKLLKVVLLMFFSKHFNICNKPNYTCCKEPKIEYVGEREVFL